MSDLSPTVHTFVHGLPPVVKPEPIERIWTRELFAELLKRAETETVTKRKPLDLEMRAAAATADWRGRHIDGLIQRAEVESK